MLMHKLDICTDIREDPIYIIRKWMSKTEWKDYVFVGKDPKVSKKVFDAWKKGDRKNAEFKKEYPKILRMDAAKTEIVYHSIYKDDNINTLRKKVSMYLFDNKPENDLYFWITKQVRNIKVFQHTLALQLLQSGNYIKKTDLESVYNIFGWPVPQDELDKYLNRLTYDDIVAIIDASTISTMTEPFGVKYLYNQYQAFITANPFYNNDTNIESNDYEIITERARTMEHYAIERNTIHVAMFDNIEKHNARAVKLYCHWHVDKEADKKAEGDSIFKVSDEVHSEVVEKSAELQVSDKFEVDCHINYLHLRLNEQSVVKPNLETLFTKLPVSSMVPFMKMKTPLKKVYKADKESMTLFDTEDFNVWVEMNPNDPKGKSGQEYIMFKVLFKIISGRAHCITVLLFPDFHIDVKYHMKSSVDVTLSEISAHFKRVNSLLTSMNADIAHIEPNFWNKPDQFSNTKIVNMASYINIVDSLSNPSFNELNMMAKSLFPFVSVIELEKEKNKMLTLQYKRIDNFVKTDNITMFLNSNYKLKEAELVHGLQQEYGVTSEEAQKAYDIWSNQQRMDGVRVGTSLFFRPANSGNVLIKMKKSSLGYKALVEGLTNILYHRRIVGLLKFLIRYSTKVHRSKLKFVKQNADSSGFDKEAYCDEDTDIKKKAFPTMSDMDPDELEDNNDDLDELEGMGLNMNFDGVGQEDEAEEQYDEADSDEEQYDEANEIEKLRKGKGKTDDEKIKDIGQYVLNRLKAADKKLFAGEKGGKTYSTSCQWVNKRQPIVITAEDKKRIDEQYPNSYDNFVNFGSTSTKMKENIYICPDIWCPISRVSMTSDEFKLKGCPNKDEPVIDMEETYWKKTKQGKRKKRFVSFVGDECYPCCFKIAPSTEGSENKNKFDKCMGKEKKVVGDAAMEKYILGITQYPLDPGRYGLLPKPLSEALKNVRCGGGGPGTGLIVDGTDCFLRQGITQHKSCSFLSCISKLLLTNGDSLVETIKSKMKISEFLTLNAGTLSSSFINPKKSMYDRDEFEAFKEWFTSKENDKYIIEFNLHTQHEMLMSMTWDDVHNRGDRIDIDFKRIMREYLVYNSYHNFLKYLDDDNVEKTHHVFLDLVAKQSDWLNPNGYNVIVFESEGDSVFVTCPHNAPKMNLGNGFVFIIKQGDTYEPIVRASQANGTVSLSFIFKYGKDSRATDMIDFYRKNCTMKTKGIVDSNGLFVYLKTLGHNVRFQVLNYNYRVVGFVVQKTNVFVPCYPPSSPLLMKNARFIYVDEVVGLEEIADGINYDTAKNLFSELYKLTGVDAYKVDKVAYAARDKQTAVGLIMKTGDVIPLSTNMFPTEHYLDNLNIFIGFAEKDDRTIFIENERYKDMLFKVLKSELGKMFLKNRDLRAELDFARSASNPFPSVVRKAELRKHVVKFLRNVALSDDAPPTGLKLESKAMLCSGLKKQRCGGFCIWSSTSAEGENSRCRLRVPEVLLKQFRSKLVDVLLMSTAGDLSQKLDDNETPVTQIAFSQSDVSSGRVSRLRDALKNPYMFAEKVVDEYVKDLLKEHVKVSKTISLSSILSNEWYNLPTELNKLFNHSGYDHASGTVGYCINKQADFKRMGLCEILVCLSKLVNSPVKLTMENINLVIENRIIHDFKAMKSDVIAQKWAVWNQVFASLMKQRRIKPEDVSADDVLSIVKDEQYTMSEYELMVMSEFLHLKIFVLARKGVRHTNHYICFKPSRTSHQSVILQRTTEIIDKLSYDKYELVVHNKDEPQVIFHDNDDPDLFKVLNVACHQYFIPVEK